MSDGVTLQVATLLRPAVCRPRARCGCCFSPRGARSPWPANRNLELLIPPPFHPLSKTAFDQTKRGGPEMATKKYETIKVEKERRHHLGDLQPSRQNANAMSPQLHLDMDDALGRSGDRRRRRRFLVVTGAGEGLLAPARTSSSIFRGTETDPKMRPQGARPRLQSMALAEALHLPDADHRDGQRLSASAAASRKSAPAIFAIAGRRRGLRPLGGELGASCRAASCPGNVTQTMNFRDFRSTYAMTGGHLRRQRRPRRSASSIFSYPEGQAQGSRPSSSPRS